MIMIINDDDDLVMMIMMEMMVTGYLHREFNLGNTHYYHNDQIRNSVSSEDLNFLFILNFLQLLAWLK